MKNIENIRLNGETYSLAPGFYDEPTCATTKIGNINAEDELTDLSIKEVVKKMVAPHCVFPEFKIENTDPYIIIGSNSTEEKIIVFCDEYKNAPDSFKAEIETWSLTVKQNNKTIQKLTGTGDDFSEYLISQLQDIEDLKIGYVTVTFEITTKAITDVNDCRYNEGKVSKTFSQEFDLTVINGIMWYETNSNAEPLTLDEITKKYTNHEWNYKPSYGRRQNFSIPVIGNNNYHYLCIPTNEKQYFLSLIDGAGHNVLTNSNLFGTFFCNNETIYVYCLGNQMLTCGQFDLKGIY